jgi:hypothetical protein
MRIFFALQTEGLRKQGPHSREGLRQPAHRQAGAPILVMLPWYCVPGCVHLNKGDTIYSQVESVSFIFELGKDI